MLPRWWQVSSVHIIGPRPAYPIHTFSVGLELNMDMGYPILRQVRCLHDAPQPLDGFREAVCVVVERAPGGFGPSIALRHVAPPLQDVTTSSSNPLIGITVQRPSRLRLARNV